MKKLLLLLLIPFISFAQTDVYQETGSPRFHTQNNGGIGSSRTLLLPIGNHDSIFPIMRFKGRFQYNNSANKLEYHNSSGWNYLADVSWVETNYKTKAQNDALYRSILWIPTLSDIGIPNIKNVDQTNPANIIQNSSYRFVTDAEKSSWNSKLSIEADGSVTNELQNLSLSGNTLTISNGNSVTIPNSNVNLTSGNRISITGTYPNLTISYVEPAVYYVNRPFNSNYTISATKQANVIYTVTLQVSNATAVGGASANVYLEVSTNGGTTWNLASQSGNYSNTAIAVTISLQNGQTGIIGGNIPANALVRLRSGTTSTGLLTPAPSITFVGGQETY